MSPAPVPSQGRGLHPSWGLCSSSFFRESRDAARPAARHAVGMSDMSRAAGTGARWDI